MFSLKGEKLEARYYRAFKLEEYIIRGNIHAGA